MGSVAGYQIHLFSNRSQSLIKVPCRMSRSGMQIGARLKCQTKANVVLEPEGVWPA